MQTETTSTLFPFMLEAQVSAEKLGPKDRRSPRPATVPAFAVKRPEWAVRFIFADRKPARQLAAQVGVAVVELQANRIPQPNRQTDGLPLRPQYLIEGRSFILTRKRRFTETDNSSHAEAWQQSFADVLSRLGHAASYRTTRTA